jgi:hypothetical protein
MKFLQGCKNVVIWWISFTKETIDSIKKYKSDSMKG